MYENHRQLEGEVELSYPCKWEYRVIGTNEDELRSAINDVFHEHPVEIKISNTSKSGKYVSLAVETIVSNEMLRTDWFSQLKAHQNIKFVL